MGEVTWQNYILTDRLSADNLALGLFPGSKHEAVWGRIRLEERQLVHLLMRGSFEYAGLLFSKGVVALHSPPLLLEAWSTCVKVIVWQACIRGSPDPWARVRVHFFHFLPRQIFACVWRLKPWMFTHTIKTTSSWVVMGPDSVVDGAPPPCATGRQLLHLTTAAADTQNQNSVQNGETLKYKRWANFLS